MFNWIEPKVLVIIKQDNYLLKIKMTSYINVYNQESCRKNEETRVRKDEIRGLPKKHKILCDYCVRYRGKRQEVYQTNSTF